MSVMHIMLLWLTEGAQASHESSDMHPDTPGDAMAPVSDRRLSTSSLRCFPTLLLSNAGAFQCFQNACLLP